MPRGGGNHASVRGVDRSDVIAELNKRISQELLGSSIPARLAYSGLDGGRASSDRVPVRRRAAVSAHRAGRGEGDGAPARPAGGDHHRHPGPVAAPRAADPRSGQRRDRRRGAGRVRRGIRKVTPAKVFPEWEAGVHALYERMARIVVEPDWAKLQDFETTLPKAVEDLMRAKTAQA